MFSVHQSDSNMIHAIYNTEQKPFRRNTDMCSKPINCFVDYDKYYEPLDAIEIDKIVDIRLFFHITRRLEYKFYK